MTKLFFFFPYMEECGVPVLFLRMSKWVSEHYGNDYECYVIDFHNGAMVRNLDPDDKVKVLIYNSIEDCFSDSISFFSFSFFSSVYLSIKSKFFSCTFSGSFCLFKIVRI